MREVFSQAPLGEREAALALGATRWGMIRTVVLPFGRGGIIGGTMLGLGRALGETIAVLLIISPAFDIKLDVLEIGTSTMSALIAGRFGEATTSQLSALLTAGFVLFVITLVVNTIAADHRQPQPQRRGDGGLMTDDPDAPRRRPPTPAVRRTPPTTAPRVLDAPRPLAGRVRTTDVLALVGAALGSLGAGLARLRAAAAARRRARLRRRAGTSPSSLMYAGSRPLTPARAPSWSTGSPRPWSRGPPLVVGVALRRPSSTRSCRAGAALTHSNFFPTTCPASGRATPLDQGGVLHAIVGTLIEVGIAVAIALPLGIGTAVYMTEVGGRLLEVGADRRRGDDGAAVDRRRPVHLHGPHRRARLPAVGLRRRAGDRA